MTPNLAEARALRATAATFDDGPLRRECERRADQIEAAGRPPVDPAAEAARLHRISEHPGLDATTARAIRDQAFALERAVKAAGPGPEAAPSLSAAELREVAAEWRRRAAATHAPDLAAECIRRALAAEQEADRLEPADPAAKPAPKPSSSPAAPAGLDERLRDDIQRLKAAQAQTRRALGEVEKALGR